MKPSEAFRYIFASAWVMAFLAVTFVLYFYPRTVPADVKEILSSNTELLAMGTGMIIQFFFGSSQGSKDKTPMLRRGG